MIDSTFDLFVDLGANDEQCDFPVVYASGANGVAGGSPEELAEDLAPLFEAIVREARPAQVFLDNIITFLWDQEDLTPAV